MNTCKTCVHKSTLPPLDEYQGWFVCYRVFHASDRYKDDPVYVQDSEDYYASLRVRDNFGCVLHETTNTGSNP